MEFIYSDLGILSGGEEFEVFISRDANVCLLDSTNFFRYKSNSDFSYIGGHYRKGVCRLQVPSAGQWYIVIDLGGEGGNIRYDIRDVTGPKIVRKNVYFTLPDGTIVYYNELSDGSVCLASVVRNGMLRSCERLVFDSPKELARYCIGKNWSRM